MASSIKVISECFVKPKYEVEAAKQPHYLGPIDLGMLSIDPIQKGLLFPLNKPADPINPPQLEIPTLLEKLERSLSLALVHFYPLAGRFATEKYEDEHACWIFVDCTKGPGARIIHATALDLNVWDILSSTDVHVAVNSFFDLGERMVNHDGHTRPLLSIQVTELADGVFIGFTMSHSVVDGTSFSYFISSLSEIFRSDDGGDPGTIPISRVPICKAFFPDGYGPILKLPYLEPEEFITRYNPGPLRERIFHFSPSSVAKLKRKANEECGTDNKISSFQALSALVWRSISRARNLQPDQGTTCNLLTNARPRLDPPLPIDYFGNFIGSARGSCKVEELLGQGLGWAAMVLHQDIMACDGKRIIGFLKLFAEKPMVAQPGLNVELFYGPNCVVIGGSAKFDMYAPEFGLGRAVGVRAGYANKDDGKVTANPGCEGGGSVDLEICLKHETMAALEADDEFMYFVSQ